MPEGKVSLISSVSNMKRSKKRHRGKKHHHQTGKCVNGDPILLQGK